MAGTFSTTYKNSMLDGSAGVPGTSYVQLHTGAPGGSGTSNVSSETTRKAITVGAASGGVRAGTGSVVSWAPIALSGTEDLTHYSIWTASSGGVFVSGGSLTTPRNGVVNGSTVNITPSDFTFAITDP
jgi:hypothetical protein